MFVPKDVLLLRNFPVSDGRAKGPRVISVPLVRCFFFGHAQERGEEVLTGEPISNHHA